MGLTFAEHLTRSVNARLILLGRSAVPSREDWENWLAAHPQEQDPTTFKIRKLQELEAMGSEVLVFRVDISDMQQMRSVIARAEKRFGPIDGVIHTAGVPDYFGVIQRRSRKMTEDVMAPKVKGTLVLDSILKDTPLDFFILCSSISSIIGPFGEVGYTAANVFLDAFAH
ncbi:MAG: SDR family NAD(P)-dependent oxidoreductase, partial [bacterium]|nr:SDR family NAD(P)-dependent oxidoreductase [bacterium]